MQVAQMIEVNKHRKEYFSFFEIGRELAAHAKYYSKQMNDEKFNFILQKYYEKGKEWCAEVSAIEGHKRISFNKWHKDLAKQTLIEQLQKHYKKWTPTL